MSASNSLRGKVVLVTGAAKRIGRAIAVRLAKEGAQVAIHFGDSRDAAKETAQAVDGQPFHADLSKVKEIQRLFDEVEKAYGRLDMLVNNAARFSEMDPLTLSEKDWDSIHDVNLKGLFFCCQAGARLMLKQGGGRIVNISSLGGLQPWERHAPYCASKAGVIMLTRTLAKAWAPKITVNSVAPGVIPFEEKDDPRIVALVKATPMKRAGSGEDIAAAVANFFKGPSFITGQVLAVDGGLSQT